MPVIGGTQLVNNSRLYFCGSQCLEFFRYSLDPPPIKRYATGGITLQDVRDPATIPTLTGTSKRNRDVPGL